MPHLIPMALVLLLVVPFAGLAADEEAAPGKEAAPPAKEAPPKEEPIPESDPAAVALLDQAIAHQAPKDLTGLDSIKDISVRIQAPLLCFQRSFSKAPETGGRIPRRIFRLPTPYSFQLTGTNLSQYSPKMRASTRPLFSSNALSQSSCRSKSSLAAGSPGFKLV